jgi:hypothetical protein
MVKLSAISVTWITVGGGNTRQLPAHFGYFHPILSKIRKFDFLLSERGILSQIRI